MDKYLKDFSDYSVFAILYGILEGFLRAFKGEIEGVQIFHPYFRKTELGEDLILCLREEECLGFEEYCWRRSMPDESLHFVATGYVCINGFCFILKATSQRRIFYTHRAITHLDDWGSLEDRLNGVIERYNEKETSDE